MIAAWKKRLRTLLERRETVYGVNRRNVELVYAHNRRSDYPTADDKALSKRMLADHGVPVPRTIAICEALYELANVMKRLESEEEFVLKPANSSGGNGIVVVKGRSNCGGWLVSGQRVMRQRDVHKHLADIVYGAFSSDEPDKAIIEERVQFHPLLDALSGGGGDLRVLTLKGRPFKAMLRLPTVASGGRANLHQGAIGVGVDIETGVTGCALMGGKPLEVHPDTGVALCGVQMPSWQQVLETASLAAGAVPLGYLGVDILFSEERGPLVVEVNARPGLEIQNVNGAGIGVALAEYAHG